MRGARTNTIMALLHHDLPHFKTSPGRVRVDTGHNWRALERRTESIATTLPASSVLRHRLRQEFLISDFKITAVICVLAAKST